MRKRTTSNNLMVPSPSAPMNIQTGQGAVGSARSPSPSGIGNKFSKWFSRSPAAQRVQAADPPRSSGVGSRKQTISQPTDLRPLGNVPNTQSMESGLYMDDASIPGPGSFYMTGMSQSVLDLSTTRPLPNASAHPFPSSGTSLGDLRSLSNKKWAHSVDDLHNLPSPPPPTLPPINVSSTGFDLATRIDQYRHSPSTPTAPSYPNVAPHTNRQGHPSPNSSVGSAAALSSPVSPPSGVGFGMPNPNMSPNKLRHPQHGGSHGGSMSPLSQVTSVPGRAMPPLRSNSSPNTNSPTNDFHPFPLAGTPPDAGFVAPAPLGMPTSPKSSMSLMPQPQNHGKSPSLSKPRSMGAIPSPSMGIAAPPRAPFMRKDSASASSVTSGRGHSDSGSERGRLDSLKIQQQRERERVDSQASQQSSGGRKIPPSGSGGERNGAFTGRPGFPFSFGGGAPPQGQPMQQIASRPHAMSAAPSTSATPTPVIVEPDTEADSSDAMANRRASQLLWHSGLVNRFIQESHKQSGMWGHYTHADADGWKPFKAVLKGSKLYFYKPPSDRSAAIRDLFPADMQQAEAAGLLGSPNEGATSDAGDDVFARGAVVVEGGSGKGKERDDPRRKRAYWGRATHPGLLRSDDGVRGSFEALVHESIFGTTFSLDATDETNDEAGWQDFASAIVLCLPRLLGRAKFETEFYRCGTYLVSGADDALQAGAKGRIAWLAKEYLRFHGPPEDEKVWADLCENTIPGMLEPAGRVPSLSASASSTDGIYTRSPNSSLSSPRIGEMQRSSSIPNTPPRRSSLNDGRVPHPRLWAALQQEGLTREIFTRLDPHLVARSLTHMFRIAFDNVPDDAFTLGSLLADGDPKLGTEGGLQAFLGSEVQPHWLTSFVVSHILGPGDTFTPAQPGNQALPGRPSVSASRTHTRSDMITSWARVGEVCRLTGNEAAWRAISAGLTSPPIARLEKVWKRVDPNAIAVVESWVYSSPSGTGTTTPSTVVVVPWLGDAQEQIRLMLARCRSHQKEDEWVVEPMSQVLQLFEGARTKFSCCPRQIDPGPASFEGEVQKLVEFWRRLIFNPSGPKYLSMDKYLKLSLAAEPRRKGEAEPHFWVRPTALQNFALVPLQFPEPLPAVAFMDRDELLQRYASHDPGQVAVFLPNFESLGMAPPNKRRLGGRESSIDMRSAALGSSDLGGTVIPLFEGELLLQVQNGSEFLPSRPTSIADSSEDGRSASRGPSIRVNAGAAVPDRRGGGVTRRSSLPPMTTRESLTVPENLTDPPLRVVVRAGTINRLVELLLFGLKGVTASIADGNDENPSNERIREVKVDKSEFSRIWWATFRSLLTPLVLFELLRKRYLDPSEGTFRTALRRTEILRVIKEWLTIGGGAQDALDDHELFRSMQVLLRQPVHLDPVTSASDEAHDAVLALDNEHRAIRSLFSQCTQRPRAAVTALDQTARPSRRNFGPEPLNIDQCSPEELVDNLDALARCIFYNITEEDLYVTADLLETQTVDRLGWFSAREGVSYEDSDVQSIHTIFMEIPPSEYITELGHDNLYRVLPPGIRSAFRAHLIVTHWLLIKIASVGMGSQRRQARMELLLQALEDARRRSAGIRSPDIMPTEQPRVRSFVEATLTAAIMSPESRTYQRAWQNVALSRGVSCESLHTFLAHTPGSSTAAWASLTVDLGWFLERILEIISIPNCVDNTTEEGQSLINFDKRRQLHYLISHLSSFASPRPTRRESERFDFERLNNMDKEAQSIHLDYKQVREDAMREAAYPAPPSSNKKVVRPFQRDVTYQLDKYKRDKHLRDRLGKEKRQEQQRVIKRDDGFQKAINVRQSRAPRAARNTKVISTLFHAFRQSVAFGAEVASGDERRTATELDFTPSGKPLQVLNITDVHVKTYVHPERPFTFQLDTDEGAHYILQVLSSTEASKWIDAIGRASKQAAQRRSTYVGMKPQVSEHLSARSATATHDPTAVFGVDLDFLLLREADGHEVPLGTIPSVLERCLAVIETRGLTEVGIYRIAGAATEINSLKEAFNSGNDPLDEMTDIYAICDLVKTWFRILPRPVFPTSSYHEIIVAIQNPDLDTRLATVRDIVHQLPRSNFDLLKRISEHLDRITDFEESNQMTSEALAIVFSPNLLRAPDQNFLLVMQNMGHAHNVVKTLIGHLHMIFDEEDPDMEEEEGDYDEVIAEVEEDDDENVPPGPFQSSQPPYLEPSLSQTPDLAASPSQ